MDRPGMAAVLGRWPLESDIHQRAAQGRTGVGYYAGAEPGVDWAPG